MKDNFKEEFMKNKKYAAVSSYSYNQDSDTCFFTTRDEAWSYIEQRAEHDFHVYFLQCGRSSVVIRKQKDSGKITLEISRFQNGDLIQEEERFEIRPIHPEEIAAPSDTIKKKAPSRNFLYQVVGFCDGHDSGSGFTHAEFRTGKEAQEYLRSEFMKIVSEDGYMSPEEYNDNSDVSEGFWGPSNAYLRDWYGVNYDWILLPLNIASGK